MSTIDQQPLPGELSAIQWHGERRGPITDSEALGTSRRLARLVASRGRPDLTNAAAPVVLPDADAKRVMAGHRLQPRSLAFAKTRAELEGRGLTAVLDQLLESYGAAPPGTRATWHYPDDDEG